MFRLQPLSRQTLRSSASTTRRLFHAAPRTMARLSPKQEWMVITPDAPGMLAKRMEVRPDHLKHIQASVDAGAVLLGGATLDEPLAASGSGGPKINGSIFLAAADSEDDVWALVKGDIYYTTGVWDVDKIRVLPYRTAVWNVPEKTSKGS